MIVLLETPIADGGFIFVSILISKPLKNHLIFFTDGYNISYWVLDMKKLNRKD